MESLFPVWKVTSIIDQANTENWTNPLTSLQRSMLSPSHWRACAQDAHYEKLDKSFFFPLNIRKDATSGAKILDIQLQFHERVSKTVSEMDGEDARQFCYKDCAVYQNVKFKEPFEEKEVFKRSYERWWPARLKGGEVGQGGTGRGAFWGMWMRFVKPGVELREIVKLHEDLSQKVKGLEGEILEPKVLAFDPRYGKERRRGGYRVMDSFGEVFVVMDRREWEVQGVVIVFRDGEVGGRYGFEGGEEVERGEGERDGGWSGFRAYRVSLVRVVEIVTGRDEERRIRGEGREWNDLEERFLGGEGGS